MAELACTLALTHRQQRQALIPSLIAPHPNPLCTIWHSPSHVCCCKRLGPGQLQASLVKRPCQLCSDFQAQHTQADKGWGTWSQDR